MQGNITVPNQLVPKRYSSAPKWILASTRLNAEVVPKYNNNKNQKSDKFRPNKMKLADMFDSHILLISSETQNINKDKFSKLSQTQRTNIDRKNLDTENYQLTQDNETTTQYNNRSKTNRVFSPQVDQGGSASLGTFKMKPISEGPKVQSKTLYTKWNNMGSFRNVVGSNKTKSAVFHMKMNPNMNQETTGLSRTNKNFHSMKEGPTRPVVPNERQSSKSRERSKSKDPKAEYFEIIDEGSDTKELNEVNSPGKEDSDQNNINMDIDDPNTYYLDCEMPYDEHTAIKDRVKDYTDDLEDLNDKAKKRLNEMSQQINFIQNANNGQGVTGHGMNKLVEGMCNLVTSIDKTVEIESKFGNMLRDYEKMRQNNHVCRERMRVMNRRINILNYKVKEKSGACTILQEKIEFQDKELSLKKNELRNCKTRIERLEKNLTALINDHSEQNKDKIRDALATVIKENDRLKRGAKVQTAKYVNQLDTKQQLETKLVKMSKSGKVKLNCYEISGQKISSNFLDIEDKIPLTLDYRNENLKPEHTKIQNEMRENGLSQVNKFRDLDYKTLRDHPEIREQMLESVQFQLDEYNNYNRLAEKLNLFCQFSYDNFFIDDIDQLIHALQDNIYEFYSCKRVNLWFREKFTGLFYCKDRNGNETRCLSDTGLIGECWKKRLPCIGNFFG